MNEIRVFCPATIANINCGFDILGLCLDGIGDEMVFRKTYEKGIKITKIVGADLSFENEKNVAGVAALAIYNSIDNITFGIEIELYKNIKTGSGIGSSSASAAGAVFGINELLGNPYSKEQLVPFAMKGEVVASGSEHADNVAPCLLGNFTLVTSYNPLDVVCIPSPKNLYAVVLHPHIEVKTSHSRAVLPANFPLKDIILQTASLGGFIAGLYTQNFKLIRNSLNDFLIEKHRKKLIPNFDLIKNAAIKNGALGSGISGAGPSIFALCEGKESAEKVKIAMQKQYSKSNFTFDMYVSKINSEGTKLM